MPAASRSSIRLRALMPGEFGLPVTSAAAAGLKRCWCESITGVCADCVAGRINRTIRVVQRLNRIRLMISGRETNRWRQLTPRFNASRTLAS
jgi:hypothetical protein